MLLNSISPLFLILAGSVADMFAWVWNHLIREGRWVPIWNADTFGDISMTAGGEQNIRLPQCVACWYGIVADR